MKDEARREQTPLERARTDIRRALDTWTRRENATRPPPPEKAVPRRTTNETTRYSATLKTPSPLWIEKEYQGLRDVLRNEQRVAPTFVQLLRAHIRDRFDGNPLRVYPLAGLDRRHFAKLNADDAYRPGKRTALALVFALRLPLKEGEEFLRSAGYAFSPSSRGDLVLRECLKHGIHDLPTVERLLDEFACAERPADALPAAPPSKPPQGHLRAFLDIFRFMKYQL